MKERKYDLYVWEDWRDHYLKLIEHYRATNRLDSLELEIHNKDGSVQYVGWYEPIKKNGATK